MPIPTQLPDVTFQPWQGQSYLTSAPRLMIVGESHWDWLGRTDVEACVTKNVVSRAIEQRAGFFAKIAALCLGEPPSNTEEREAFWESVSFYNYVQSFAGNAPRVRPTRSMWRQSEPAFAVVLKELKPQLIVVLGRQNWENMPELGGMAGEPLTTLGSPYADTWLYPTDGGEYAPAFHVRHPSSWGFNFRKFVPLFNEARARVTRN